MFFCGTYLISINIFLYSCDRCDITRLLSHGDVPDHEARVVPGVGLGQGLVVHRQRLHLGVEADTGVGDNLAHQEVHDTVELVHVLEGSRLCETPASCILEFVRVTGLTSLQPFYNHFRILEVFRSFRSLQPF